jgi:hypothetical protein
LEGGVVAEVERRLSGVGGGEVGEGVDEEMEGEWRRCGVRESPALYVDRETKWFEYSCMCMQETGGRGGVGAVAPWTPWRLCGGGFPIHV